ncbi:MAG: PA0069 family radical SAM protein [Flavobacteriales bacterium]|nr:PA0069 family radical SAM protein [Flavobacteriales bacterium]
MAGDGKSVNGRGARGQVANRFDARQRVMEHLEAIDEPLEEAGATRYLAVEPRTIVNRVDSADLPFVHSLNPYQGCEHGCAYCYARPTHEYWGYSAGLDFEQVILVKRNAPDLLRDQLRHRKWVPDPISISGATDPYQPIERKEGITRRLLEVALEFKQPVSVITKNALVLRDVDLLGELAEQGLAAAAISITTLNEDLRRAMEPRTSTAQRRLAAIAGLSAAGVPVMAMVAPVIPALNEAEVPAILEAAADAGATTAGYTMLRTNGAVEPVFIAWLREHFPDRADRVLHEVRSVHEGSLSDSRIGRRMRGTGARADHIARLFHVMRRRYFGEARMPPLRTDLFRPPPQGQLGLFDSATEQ